MARVWVRFGAVLLALSLLVMPGVRAQPAAEPLSAAAFTQQMLVEAQRQAPGVAWRVEQPLMIYGKLPDGTEQNMLLGNAYDVFRTGRSGIAELVSQRLSVDMFAKPQFTAVMALVKPIAYLADVLLQVRQVKPDATELPFLYERLNEDLVVVYALDGDKGIRMMNSKNMTELGLDLAGVRALARQNLKRYFDNNGGAKIKRMTDTGASKIYMIRLDENYEASALLIDSLWEKLDVAGAPVVFLPARNVLLLTGSDDEDGLTGLRPLAKKLHATLPYAISPEAFLRKDGSWVRLAP